MVRACTPIREGEGSTGIGGDGAGGRACTPIREGEGSTGIAGDGAGGRACTPIREGEGSTGIAGDGGGGRACTPIREGEGCTGIAGDGGAFLAEAIEVIDDNCTPTLLTSSIRRMSRRACIAVTPHSTNSSSRLHSDNTSAVTPCSVNLGITTCSLMDVSHRSNSSSVNCSRSFTKGEGGGGGVSGTGGTV